MGSPIVSAPQAWLHGAKWCYGLGRGKEWTEWVPLSTPGPPGAPLLRGERCSCILGNTLSEKVHVCPEGRIFEYEQRGMQGWAFTESRKTRGGKEHCVCCVHTCNSEQPGVRTGD